VVECERLNVRKVVALTFLLGLTTVFADGLRIVPLVRGSDVLVSFQMSEGFTEDVRAAIHSGLKTTFTYTIDLRTAVAVWLDRTIESVVVSTSVQYDNLTRRHVIVRSLDGRVDGDALIVDSDDEVRQLVTRIDRRPLFRTTKLEPNREYYVRVRAEIRPRNAAFLWPWGSGTSAQAKFTFIP
jgi:hypothetical protein